MRRQMRSSYLFYLYYFITELKNYHLPHSVHLYNAFDIADPSSMQEA